MSNENHRVSFTVDDETLDILKNAADLSSVSLKQFCLEAAKEKADLAVLLHGDKSSSGDKEKDRWLPIFEKTELADDPDNPTRERKMVWEVNGEGMVRWGVKTSKEEALKALERLDALREKIFQGRVSSTDSADLIREAREERHWDMEGHGNS